MAASTGAIKGGMAYVQAFLDDNELTRGLATLQTKLKTWQASISAMGAKAYGGELPEPFAALARFAASPAGAFSGLLAAAHHTATAREEMLRMSETTGVAVDKLSALSYAARRAGVSNEALASALKRMQGREFMSAMQGAGGKGGGVRGATAGAFSQMGHGDAADKLREFIKLAEGMSEVEKIGLARRMGLMEILPLINQGIASLDAFTARAKELGLVMNESDAKAAKQFKIVMGELHDVIMSGVSAIGSALIPMLTGLTNIIVRGVVVVRDWIREHQTLTLGLFALTGAIVAGGIALKVMAIATGIASAAVGILSIAYSVATGVVAVFSAVLYASALPFILIGGAIAALIVYLAYMSGKLDWVGDAWNRFTGNISSSISAIATAISAGNLEAAWKVVIAQLAELWQGFIVVVKGGLNSLWMVSDESYARSLSELRRKGKELEAARAEAMESGSGASFDDDKKPQRELAAQAVSEVRGTFSGQVAGMLGGMNVQQQQLDTLNQIRDSLHEQAAQQKRTADTIRDLVTVN